MNITKYGHACLYLEKDGAHILVDPGTWSSIPENVLVDAVFITHEHFDHVSVETIKALIAKNPALPIYAPLPVIETLKKENIPAISVEEGETTTVSGIPVKAFGHAHAIIYGTVSPCVNRGYLIANELFIPGDALDIIPDGGAKALALPTSGPWMKLSEAIDYAKAVKAPKVFPIHDALYTEEVRRGMIPRMFTSHLHDANIEFVDLPDNSTIEI